MFRTQILRRSLPLPKRSVTLPPVRNISRHDSSVTVQRVRFKQRFFTWKRLATGMIYTSAFYAYWHFIIGPEDGDFEGEHGAVEDASGAEGDYNDEDYDEEFDPIFIPLTWAKPRPRTFYKGSDPEWQEFRKVASDRKRHAKIREQLVSIVRNALAKDPRFTTRLGQINLTQGNYWLDIIFPDGPPQEYERAGIEISDDHIYWTTRPVTQQNYNRLQRVLWPTAAFDSLYASGSYLFYSQLHNVKQLFGIESSAGGVDEQFHKHMREHMQRWQGFPRSAVGPGTSTDAAKRTADSDPKVLKSGASENGSNPKEKNVGLPNFSATPPQSIALSIFASTLAKNWKPLAMEPPRGTIVVSGLVEVKGGRARCTMDVVAAYDPKQDKYVMLRAGVRRIQDRHQHPKGGR